MKGFLLTLVVLISLVLFLLQFSRSESGIIIINLNSTNVWWNDSLLVYGKILNSSNQPISNALVRVKLLGQTCETYSLPDGSYNCTLLAPLELGTYTLWVNATKDTLVLTNSSTLEVKVVYGETPTSLTERSVLEKYYLMQEPSGNISMVKVRLIVWKG